MKYKILKSWNGSDAKIVKRDLTREEAEKFLKKNPTEYGAYGSTIATYHPVPNDDKDYDNLEMK